MKYSIQSISEKTFEDSQTKKKVILPGFAFVDELNKCFLIVYGKHKLKSITKFLK